MGLMRGLLSQQACVPQKFQTQQALLQEQLAAAQRRLTEQAQMQQQLAHESRASCPASSKRSPAAASAAPRGTALAQHTSSPEANETMPVAQSAPGALGSAAA